MAETLQNQMELVVVTPDRQVARGGVVSVSIPGKDGYLGVLPGHAPLLTELGIGELSYTEGKQTSYLAVTWGFAEVLPGRVVVLANTAERAEEIDVERAERARQRAEERLKKVTDSEVDAERAREALRRAVARLETARHPRP